MTSRWCTLVVAVVGLATILTVLGVWSWKIKHHNEEVQLCAKYKDPSFLKRIDDCKRLSGYIAIYLFLFLLMAIVDLIAWLMFCCCDNICCKVTAMVFTIFSIIGSILLLVFYNNYGPNKQHRDANIMIGSLTLVVNVIFLILFTLFTCQREPYETNQHEAANVETNNDDNT